MLIDYDWEPKTRALITPCPSGKPWNVNSYHCSQCKSYIYDFYGHKKLLCAAGINNPSVVTNLRIVATTAKDSRFIPKIKVLQSMLLIIKEYYGYEDTQFNDFVLSLCNS